MDLQAEAVAFSLEWALESPEGLVKQTDGPPLQDSDNSNKFPGDADAADPGAHFENHWPRKLLSSSVKQLSSSLLYPAQNSKCLSFLNSGQAVTYKCV